MSYHCCFSKGTQACSGATRVETHTLAPLTHYSMATLLNGIFCNREGRLSSNLAVCFYQPWVLPLFLADMANYSLERMLQSHLWCRESDHRACWLTCYHLIKPMVPGNFPVYGEEFGFQIVDSSGWKGSSEHLDSPRSLWMVHLSTHFLAPVSIAVPISKRISRSWGRCESEQSRWRSVMLS